MLLSSLSFSYAHQFFHFSFSDSLKVYLSIGGIPEYLLKPSTYDSADSFYREEFFNRYGYFYHEPYFILSQEFRELKIYQSVLHAVALGNTAPTTIAQFSGLDTRHIYPYLESMIRLGLIEKEVSILGNARQGIYRIKDRVFDFWYRFVFSHRQEMAAGAQIQAPEIPRRGGLQLLAPGIAGEINPHLIHFEVSILEGRKVQAGLQRLRVPGQARALKVQAGVDRAQALERLRSEVLNFLELLEFTAFFELIF